MTVGNKLAPSSSYRDRGAMESYYFDIRVKDEGPIPGHVRMT